LIKPGRLPARIRQSLDIEFRPNFGFIKAAIERGLGDRLAHADAADKTAVVVGDSLWLAGVLGLRKARLLHLPFPYFTIENLALLSDEYDFVIADRLLHRCDSVTDAARETVRVLRPGGWFVHTSGRLDLVLNMPAQRGLRTPQGLRTLFSTAAQLPGSAFDASGQGGSRWVSWVVGRKTPDTPAIAPSVATRVATKRPRYYFRPRASRFAVTAMARNEAPYLLEWIAYYRVLGFGQITIYDNCSNDASPRILHALSKAGIINAVHWKNRRRKQARAYEQAARRLRPFVEWCLYADIDEFLVLDDGLRPDDIVPPEKDVLAVLLCWRMFRSVGRRNRDTRLVIEQFTKAAPTNARVVKSLVRIAAVRRMTVHMPKASDAERMVDAEGRTVEGMRFNAIARASTGRARLNHYKNRSWEEFQCKRARGIGSAREGVLIPEASFRERDGPEVELTDILRLVPTVKTEVARLRRIVDQG
jgi:SAM-dependent methyltransferase